MKFNVSGMLFEKIKWPVPYCPGVTVPNAFTTTQAPTVSMLRPKTPTMRPTPSRLCIVLDKIFNGEVAALLNDSGEVYIEMSGKSGIDYAFFNGSQLSVSDSSDSIKISNVCIAAVLFNLLQRDGEAFDELRSAYTDVLTEYKKSAPANSVTTKSLGLLCDSFYYNSKNECSTLPMVDMSDEQKKLIEQAVRTSHIHEVPSEYSEGFVKNIFAHINYDPASAVATSAMSSSTIFEDAKAGTLYIDYDWDEKSMNNITDIDFLDGYIPNAAYEKAVKLIKAKTSKVMDRLSIGETGRAALRKDYVNLIMVGKPGTGKTTTAEALSATFGLPLYTARLSKNTEEGEFEGMPKIAEGSFVLKATPFLECFEKGGIVVLEEFNLADPAVMQGALGQAIEHPSVLMKDGVEPIYRHPLCIIIATMNTGTQGSREPNEAFSSRLPYVFSIDDPKEEEFLSILETRSGKSRAECNKVYKCYKDILNYLVAESGSEEMALCVTMRHCFAALDMLDYEEFTDAIYDTMIGALKIRDIRTAEDVYEAVVKAKKRR